MPLYYYIYFPVFIVAVSIVINYFPKRQGAEIFDMSKGLILLGMMFSINSFVTYWQSLSNCNFLKDHLDDDIHKEIVGHFKGTLQPLIDNPPGMDYILAALGCMGILGLIFLRESYFSKEIERTIKTIGGTVIEETLEKKYKLIIDKNTEDPRSVHTNAYWAWILLFNLFATFPIIYVIFTCSRG